MVIIILESSISLVDYDKREEFLFSLDYKPTCFNKLTDDSFLISMIDKKNNYFFNEYKIKIENNKSIIECLGYSNIEKEKMIKLINLGNNEVLTLNEHEIIFWKKNRKLLKQKETKNEILKMKKKENIQNFNVLTDINKNESGISNSFFNTISGNENDMDQDLFYTKNNFIFSKLKKNRLNKTNRTNINNNKIRERKMIEESKIVKNSLPSPYNSLLLSTDNISNKKFKAFASSKSILDI